MNTLKTYVAPLLTRNNTPIADSNGEPIYWLDEMLQGGLRRPDGLNRPLVVLISGPMVTKATSPDNWRL